MRFAVNSGKESQQILVDNNWEISTSGLMCRFSLAYQNAYIKSNHISKAASFTDFQLGVSMEIHREELRGQVEGDMLWTASSWVVTSSPWLLFVWHTHHSLDSDTDLCSYNLIIIKAPSPSPSILTALRVVVAVFHCFKLHSFIFHSLSFYHPHKQFPELNCHWFKDLKRL